jgi:hypothetical protein
VGSYQGCSEALHGLAREAATATATAKWRQMGVRSVHEALGIYRTRTTCTLPAPPLGYSSLSQSLLSQ